MQLSSSLSVYEPSVRHSNCRSSAVGLSSSAAPRCLGRGPELAICDDAGATPDGPAVGSASVAPSAVFLACTTKQNRPVRLG